MKIIDCFAVFISSTFFSLLGNFFAIHPGQDPSVFISQKGATLSILSGGLHGNFRCRRSQAIFPRKVFLVWFSQTSLSSISLFFPQRTSCDPPYSPPFNSFPASSRAAVNCTFPNVTYQILTATPNPFPYSILPVKRPPLFSGMFYSSHLCFPPTDPLPVFEFFVLCFSLV